jgi:hypothetical protein
LNFRGYDLKQNLELFYSHSYIGSIGPEHK